jgi:hypothetical protein
MSQDEIRRMLGDVSVDDAALLANWAQSRGLKVLIINDLATVAGPVGEIFELLRAALRDSTQSA